MEITMASFSPVTPYHKDLMRYVSTGDAGNGYVYAIQNEDNGKIKIGITKDLKRRFGQLRTQSGCNLKLLIAGVFLDQDEPIKNVEKLMHTQFKEQRKIGEWFELNEEQKKELTNLFWTFDLEEIVENI